MPQDLFGVKVQAKADTSAETKKAFVDSVQELAKGVDVELTKISVKKENQATQRHFRSQIQQLANTLTGDKAPSIPVIKIKEIDCSSAIKDLHTQIQSMLNSLKVTGYTVSTSFLGEELKKSNRTGMAEGLTEVNVDKLRGALSVVERLRNSLTKGEGFELLNGKQQTSFLNTVHNLRDQVKKILYEGSDDFDTEFTEIQKNIKTTTTQASKAIEEVKSKMKIQPKANEASTSISTEDDFKATYNTAVGLRNSLDRNGSNYNILSKEASENFRTQADDIVSYIQEIGLSTDMTTEEAQTEIKSVQNSLNDLKNEIQATAVAQKNSQKDGNVINDDGSFTNAQSLRKYINEISSLKNKSQKLMTSDTISPASKLSLSEYIQEFDGLSKAIAKGETYVGKFGNQINTLFDSQEALDNFKQSFQSVYQVAENGSKKADVGAVESLRRSILKYADANPKVLNKYSSNFESMLERLKTTGRLTEEELKSINNEYKTIQASAEESSITGKNTVRKLMADYIKYGSWNLVTSSMSNAINTLKEMVANVTEVDTAMVELKKVTEETNITYSKFLDTATDKAKQLGVSISDFVTSTADFARMGYNLQESTDLANVATMYMNVGDDLEGINEASSDIISTLKAFGMEASNAQSIVDKLNEVSNNYAVSSGDLGEGLKNSAASMSVAGNTLDETLALLTAMTEITQSADESGNALKVLAMRLRGMKTELGAAGEDTEGMIENTSELQAKIKALTKTSDNSGVDIMKDDGSFKSTYDILVSIAKVWSELNDTNKASILELIAGKTRSNYAAAVIQNIETAENALKTAENSAGSASKENEKYIDSIQGKTGQFSASWQELSTSVMNSEIIKGTVDAGSGLLGFLTALNEHANFNGTGLTSILASAGISAYLGKDKGEPRMTGSRNMPIYIKNVA